MSFSRMRKPMAFTGALAFLMLLVPLALPAFAGFTSNPAASSMTISTATLAAPTSLAASNVNCQIATSTQVKPSWTATSAIFADGYEIFRSTTNGGPYTSKGTVSGRNTTTFTDTAVAFSTTYYYVIQSTKMNWRSANSTQVSITTPTVLCL